MENWDDLKYILAVYQHGNISNAAKALGVNHATVSRRISAVEHKSGQLVFGAVLDN